MRITIDPSSSEPPYEQVRRQIATAAADGTLAPGHRLPTVRALATELGLATGTVARAYRELETDQVVRTEGRRGTFITSRTSSPEAESAAAELVLVARRAGLSLPETTRLVELHWQPGASTPKVER